MSEKLLLELVLILVALLIALFAYMAKKHDENHLKILNELEELSELKLQFIETFAKKDELVRLHSRLDEQQEQIGQVSTRLHVLESKVKG